MTFAVLVVAVVAIAIADTRPRLAAWLVGGAVMGAGLISDLFLGARSIEIAAIVGFAIIAFASSGRLAAVAAVTAIAITVLTRTVQQRDVAGPDNIVAAILAAGGGTALIALIIWHHQRRAQVALERVTNLVEDIPVGIFRASPDGSLVEVNSALARIVGAADRKDLLAIRAPDLFDDPGDLTRILEEVQRVGFAAGETLARRFDGTSFWARYRIARVLGRDGTTRWYEGTADDITPEREATATAELLAATVESAVDAISTIDLDGRVTAWNFAAERVYGWSRAEMLGQSIDRIVPADGLQVLTDAMNHIVAGEKVVPFETERLRRTGERIPVLMTLSPIRGADGSITGVSGIARDLTERRLLEGRIEQAVRERTEIVRTLSAIDPGRTVDETAGAISRAIATTSAFRHVALLGFEAEAVRVLDVSAHGVSVPEMLVPITASRAIELRELAGRGPWVEDLRRLRGNDHRSQMRRAGVRALGYAPIEFGGEVVGLLVAGTGPEERPALVERLGALVEFAAVAGALLGPDLAGRRESTAEHARVRSIIESRAFHPVFQSVVDLGSGAVLGYEALTRFDDGTPPDQLFAAADRSSLGIDLEVVTIEAALAASGPLPANVFLDLNVSPDLLLAREPLRTMLRKWGWGVVLEVTEHAPIEDYAAVRQAVSEIGTNVRLAVDDAGAGFASLRHVLELRPAFIKLDRTLITGIDSDPARQALVAGMHHIATTMGATIVAEGVETEEERSALLTLGVTAAQGYLFGRPIRLEDTVRKPRIVKDARTA
jgi:PAS domain S-box-containing protein